MLEALSLDTDSTDKASSLIARGHVASVHLERHGLELSIMLEALSLELVSSDEALSLITQGHIA